MCSGVGHLTGDPSCPNLRGPTADCSNSGSSPTSGKMVSEETTNLGITDHFMQKLVKSVKGEAVERMMVADAAPKAGRLHSNSL